MGSHPTLAFNQPIDSFYGRTACLILFVAMIFAESNVQVFAAQPVTTVSGANNEQSIPQRTESWEYPKYAFFWLLDQGNQDNNGLKVFPRQNLNSPPYQGNRNNYRPTASPRLNLNTSPAADDRFANEAKRKIVQQLRETPAPPPTTGPLLLIVSIPKQTITLYDAVGVVVVSPISSGTSANPTPTGIFSVIERNWWHRSNIYSAAPMPYMQRITWEGVALHAGELPGYAASHGCVRLPYDFALRLWKTTKIGARVIISHDDVAPIEISHPRLFTLQSEADRIRVSSPESRAIPAGGFQSANTTVSLNISSVMPHPPDSGLDGSSPGALAPSSESLIPQSNQRAKSQTSPNWEWNTQTPRKRRSGMNEGNLPDNDDDDLTPSSASLIPQSNQRAESQTSPNWERSTQTPSKRKSGMSEGNLPDNDDDDLTTKSLKLLDPIGSNYSELDGLFEILIVRPSLPAGSAVAQVGRIPSQDPNIALPGVPTLSSNAASVTTPNNSPNNATPYPPRSFLAANAPSTTQITAQDPVMRPGPVSILVSQKDQRLYVRKGLNPVFDFPIVIRKTGRQLGTHVFTAIAQNEDGMSMRWTVVSMPSTLPRVSSQMPAKPQMLMAARDALDRLELSEQAVDRISALMSVGATLIITDQSIGRQALALDSDYMITTH
jgi:lipoprotein-anchoring transpeptidase ErfK/SrfK